MSSSEPAACGVDVAAGAATTTDAANSDAVVAQLFKCGLVVWWRTSSLLTGLYAKWCQGEVAASFLVPAN